MANVRLWHSYLSVFVAPCILFFTLTGALQLFDLHEAHGSYAPPVLVEKLGRLHKDQVFAQDERQESPTADESNAPAPPAVVWRTSTLLLKWFFLAAAVVLLLSTGLGLWIALTHPKRRRLSALLFVAGTLLPIGLLAL